ncbi:MAG: RNase A-like domain-containing protein [Planctomycetota bacterium]
MEINPRLKAILTIVFIVGVFAYSRYHGGNAPLPTLPASNPTTQTGTTTDASDVKKPDIAPRETPFTPKPPVAQPTPNVPVSPAPRIEPEQPKPQPQTRTTQPQPRDDDKAPIRDLDQDERRHGHTLARHVGRTDQQLIDRLAAESVSSASTWSDKQTAERTIGSALVINKGAIDAWTKKGRVRENLAFDYFGNNKIEIGRSVRRGATKSVPCYNAKIVLKADGDSFYVLTAYPESR